MKKFILVSVSLFFLFSTVNLHAQWSRTYEGTGDEEESFVIPRNDGGYFLVCNMSLWDPVTWEGQYFFVILQLNSDGEILDQGAVGGTDWISINSVNPTSDGGLVLAGSIGIVDPDEYWWEYIWIAKLDENGDVDWEKKYGGEDYEYASSIQQTSDGGYIVVGETDSSGAGEEDIWVLKLDADGDVEWQKTYGGRNEEEGYSVQQTSDGGYIVAGSTDSFGAPEENAWVLKLESDGDIEWQRTYGTDEDEYAYSIQQTSDGGYILSGEAEEIVWALKLEADGDIEWQKTYRGSEGWNYDSLIQQTNDGGYLIVCLIESEDPMTWDWWYDVRALKLDSNGDIEWQRIYDENKYDYNPFLQVMSDGSYIITAITAEEDPVTFEWEEYIWVLKLYPDGDIDPSCDFIKTSDATTSATSITPADSTAIPQDTIVTPSDTDLDTQPSDLTSTLLCTAPKYTLTTATGTGGTTDPVPGTNSYYKNTDVQVEAIPDNDYRFDEWTGDVPAGDENDNPVTITMDEDKSITANFIRLYTLTIAAGTGGTTSPSPGSYQHDTGIQVSITANANSGYEFSGWTGDASGTTNPIAVTMDANKSITANFTASDGGGAGDEDGDEDGDGGTCFIATATYGSALHPHVNILREFRDKYLLPNSVGRAFVNFYYKHSPDVADFISTHAVLKTVVRIHLLPLIGFCYLMVHFGSVINAIVLISVFMFPILVVFFTRRRMK